MTTKTANTVNTKTKGFSGKDFGVEVAKKAYELYVRRGKRPGHAIDDWLEAERLVKQKGLSR